MTNGSKRLDYFTRIGLAAFVGLIALWSSPALNAAEKAGKVRLFILSGQSNMAGLNPDISFTPTVKAAFAGDEVIVVKDAVGGRPIRCWYKKWKPAGGEVPKGNGDLYDRLMKKVKAAAGDKKPATISFVWMQGERDAKTGHGTVYAASLAGKVGQLRDDLGRQDVDFVIGRLSDHLKNHEGWDQVRKAQAEVAEADRRGAWVDTDDLNGAHDGLHYDRDGYKTLGQRFAEKAIELIKRSEK